MFLVSAWFPSLLCICIFSTFLMIGLGITVWLCSFGLPKQSHMGAANSLESNNRFCSSVLVKLWLYLENDRLHKLCINIHFILDCEKKSVERLYLVFYLMDISNDFFFSRSKSMYIFLTMITFDTLLKLHSSWICLCGNFRVKY